MKKAGNGIYAFVLEGGFSINGQQLEKRDGFGVWNTDELDITANAADARLLLMEVPMEVA